MVKVDLQTLPEVTQGRGAECYREEHWSTLIWSIVEPATLGYVISVSITVKHLVFLRRR